MLTKNKISMYFIMDILTCQNLIDDIDRAIAEKEKEIMNVQLNSTNDATLNAVISVHVSQLQASINELQSQRMFYSEYVRERLMANCESCSRCSKCKYFL